MTKSQDINKIANFLSQRDIPNLEVETLKSQYGVTRFDVCVLFGGSIITGGNLFAQAIKNQIAKHYVIVGGAGHTTPDLIKVVNELYPELDITGMSEAEIFQRYIQHKYNVQADCLETKSTNCGNNIDNLLSLLDVHKINLQTILMMQDSTMMLRMTARMNKMAPNVLVTDFSTYQAEVEEVNGELQFTEKIPGMWSMEHYISLLLGEISRLTDDENGYGPKGENFILHVDIPSDVDAAYKRLSLIYPNLIRTANPKFA
ncbi:hypothetical protein [Companilactobacillus ginsenosidimutans]|uniref:DUF218 domain-containing protein n=1 Tax=Companilactobacillus ginsenosidimutans TaxID=1007676 RepID=A0A0H4QG10_9LACO|nr:hypothetical protein [Companilactobacillus ginsenosidimutans]AKP67354.1 hypothetical protein ABM34_07255 [Companilactobacillus ginsenosidimutans]